MKKRRILSFLTALAVFFTGFLLSPVSAAELPEGEGTESSPYIITTPEELSFIYDFPGACYRLGSDITLPASWDNMETSFTGVFDGDGYRLSMDGTATSQVAGLLFFSNRGVIRNVIVSGQVSVSNSRPSRLESALLCDINSNTGLIENCVAEGSITVRRSQGTTGEFTAGGLVTSNRGIIRNCYSRVDFTYTYPTNDTTQSYTAYIGGIAGKTSGGEISSCYYAGTFTGSRGFYPITYISVFGDDDKTFHNNFHDRELSGRDNSNAATTAKSTLAMKMRETYKDWDFDNTWRMAEDVNDGYPYLAMERRYAVALTGIALSDTALHLQVGETAVLTPVFTPDNATNQTVTWQSANPAVATVEGGTVTALAAGTTEITVTSAEGGFTASCSVTVPEQATELPTIPPTTVPVTSDFTYEIADNGTIGITGYTGTAAAVTIPAEINGRTVTEIESNAFHAAEITSIFIPATVTDIESDAFLFCATLASFTVDEANRTYSTDENGVLFNKNKTELICMPAGSPVTEYTIPQGVTELGDFAFFDCTHLTAVTFPASLREIDDYTFYGCVNLTEAPLLDGVREIGDYAFGSCAALQTVTIPASVTKIDEGAFIGCDNLQTVYYDGTARQWDAIEIEPDNACLYAATLVLPLPTTTGTPNTEPPAATTQPAAEPSEAPTTEPAGTSPSVVPTTEPPTTTTQPAAEPSEAPTTEPAGTSPSVVPTTEPPTTATQPAYVLGDLNGDGSVTSADARLALRAAVGLESLSVTQTLAADVDQDDHIRSADARLILRVAVGLATFGNDET